MKVNEWLINNLLPSHCMLCLVPTATQALCDSCHADLPWLVDNQQCTICALPLPTTNSICGSCLKTPPLFDRCKALFKYYSPIDTLISQFKYEGNLATGELLSHLLVTHLPPISPPPDLLIPMPLHRSRLQERGFNQTSLLADALSKHFSVPLDHHLCKRVRATHHQMGLNAGVRKKNLRGAFSCTQTIANKSIAIIDDVVTTGATANELANALRRAGARHIEVWCLARTPAHT